MAKKIEGWTGSIRNWGEGLYSHEMIISDEPPFLDRRTYKAISAVIHDGERERVFTQSEVRELLRELIEDQARCDVHNGWQSGVIPDFAGIATKHGVSLDPA